MTANAVTNPPVVDRSDFKHVLGAGTRLGLVTAGAVVATLIVTRLLGESLGRDLLVSLIVLGAAVGASLLPGQWAVARTVEGVAGAAAIGLCGAVVFAVIDIVLLRPLKAYPWTWDAVGGGSSWWYLPVWWMLGTFVAWMGGLLTAARNHRAAVTLGALALPVVGATIVLTAAGKALGCPASLPLLVGGGYAVSLTVLAVVALIRTRHA
jgi:hypothetical protein